MMHSQNLKEDIKRDPILIAFIACWALEAAMNALYGYRRGGGGIGAVGYAAVFFAIACIAAWLPIRLGHIARYDPWRWAKVPIFCLLIALCFGLSQMAGNAVMGVTVADGAAKRDKAAENYATQQERLKAFREERARLGVQPDPSQIEARIQAELLTTVGRYSETVGSLSKDCKDVSEAPNACGRVVKLRAELATAKRKADLDRLIEAQGARVGGTEAIAGGSPETKLIADATGWSDDDVRRGWNVALVFVFGLFANFGFALLDRSHGRGTSSSDVNWGSPHALAPSAAPPSFSLLAAPAQTISPPPLSPPQTVNHFHVGAASPVAPGAPAAPSPQPLGPSPQAQPAAAGAPHPSTQLMIAASPAPDKPVDRNPVRQLIDDILIFKAHALIEQQGAAIGADDLYNRYAAWAGPKAVAKDAFHTMFCAATSARSAVFGGIQHYADISLRPVQLKAMH